MTTTTTTTTTETGPKITLYTNHQCPYAQRAHIALDVMKLPHDEVIIDLATPRPQWYLDINPRGLVPSVKYSHPDLDGGKEVIITESAVVAQFLAEAHPERGGTALLPPLGVKGAAERARMNFFLDTWNSKITSPMFGILMAATTAERDEKCDAWFQAIEKEIEPLLQDANPFFNGSTALTFVEVLAGPMILRWYAIGQDGELIPQSFVEKLEALPNFSKWAAAVRGDEVVTKMWSDDILDNMKAMVKKRKAAQQQK